MEAALVLAKLIFFQATPLDALVEKVKGAEADPPFVTVTKFPE